MNWTIQVNLLVLNCLEVIPSFDFLCLVVLEKVRSGYTTTKIHISSGNFFFFCVYQMFFD